MVFPGLQMMTWPQLWTTQLIVMTEDLLCLAVGVFQAWVFVVLFLIMLPAMFGLSLGVTGVYIQILVKVLEVPKIGHESLVVIVQ